MKSKCDIYCAVFKIELQKLSLETLEIFELSLHFPYSREYSHRGGVSNENNWEYIFQP